MFALLGVLLVGEGGFMPKYLFQGSYIGDLPDNVSAAAFSLAINNTGKAKGRVTPLMTPEEMDQVITKSPSYRAPGES